MYSTTTQYKADVQKSSREWDFKATFTYKNQNGTVTRELTKYDVAVSSVRVESGCIPGSLFEFGANISKKFTIEIQNKNEEYNGCTINGGTIVPYVGLVLSTGSVEWIPLGTFYIYKASKPLRTIKIEAADFMTKFEKKYNHSVTFPCTLKQIVDDICNQAGIELDGDFYNSGYTVQEDFLSGSLYSYREIIKYISIAAGGYATITRDNKLKIKSIEITSSPYLIDPDKTRISSEFSDIKKFTGLLYRKNNNNKFFGTDETPIIIQNNIILNSLSETDLDEILENLYNKYLDFEYIPCKVEMRSDPSLDEGDTISCNKTTDGTVVSFIGDYYYDLGGKYTIKSPDTSVLDSDFLLNKYDRENSKNVDMGGNEKVVNPNLLLISKFTKAFLPYSFVGKWSYTNYDTMGVECLDTYMMCAQRNKIWLPFAGDIVGGETYTLSLLIKSRDKRKTPKWTVCLVPSYTIYNGYVKLNDIADKAGAVSSGNGTIVLGNINLTAGWDWQILTFTVPLNLPYQNDISQSHTSGNRGYMIALYADQQGLYSESYTSNYAAHLALAKLEVGSERTDWCLGEAEKASINEVLDDFGRTRKTISSLVNTQVAVYEEHKLELAATQIHYNEDGKIMVMRQKREGESGLANQIIISGSALDMANGTLDLDYYISMYSLDGTDLHIKAPGSVYINGVQQ